MIILDQYVWSEEYGCIVCHHDNDDLAWNYLLERCLAGFNTEEWPLKLTDYVMRLPDPLIFQS